MSRFFLALFIAALLAPGTGQAATFLAAVPCKSWLEYRGVRGDPAGLAWGSTMWVLGFLNGAASATGTDALKGADAITIQQWMDRYCRDNPLSDTWYGSSKLFVELLRNQGMKL